MDVLAADVYHEDWKQSHRDDLARLAQGKPIALGEDGGYRIAPKKAGSK